eukprot:g1326.t1
MSRKASTPGVLGKLSEYELARLERIKKINAAMQAFDLKAAVDDLSKEKKILEDAKKKKRAVAHRRRQLIGARKKNSGNASPPRRSNRKRNKPAQYVPEDLDALMSGGVVKKSRVRRNRQAMVVPELDENQRRRLRNAEADWLDEFEHFLLHIPHGRNGKVISEQNARSVMRQVRVLVSGSGVYYRHWDEGVVCFKGRPVTLTTDFVSLYEEAKEFENEHGRDRGNGWLLLHPITKLLCFQIHKIADLDEHDDDESAAADASKSPDASDGEEEDILTPSKVQENVSSSNQPKSTSASDLSWLRSGARVTLLFNGERFEAKIDRVRPTRVRIVYDVDGSNEYIYRRDFEVRELEPVNNKVASADDSEWLQYVTTKRNETLLSISKMENAPSVEELIKNNESQFPGITKGSRLRKGTTIWIREAQKK